MNSLIKTNGNIFDKPGPIVVTVNTVGAMGAGVAKEFKDRYPHGFKYYKELVKEGYFKDNCINYWKDDLGDGKEFILMVTKEHFWDKGSLIRINDGLIELSDLIEENLWSDIYLPPLGCGCGGLDWFQQVEPIVVELLDDAHPDLKVYVVF